jgi:NAD(P)-dependent dehydrogenase (short-subunit alcohol dehydrogenase family)
MNPMWSINRNGAILCDQAACKQFKQEGKGVIINFAADVAMAGMPNGAIYAASKGAVLSWTRTIAMEWAAKYNIRCNCVNPTMKTPMFEEYKAGLTPAALSAFLASEKQRVPQVARWATPIAIWRRSCYFSSAWYFSPAMPLILLMTRSFQ